jgi:FixJ family two-component response regulator
MPLGKRTIAIVEDDASFRRTLERLLRAFGFDVHTLASAEEFLRSVAPESHCLPFLDLQLSGNVGFELLDQSHRVHPRAPAIFFTSQENGPPAGASALDSKQRLSAQAIYRTEDFPARNKSP